MFEMICYIGNNMARSTTMKLSLQNLMSSLLSPSFIADWTLESLHLATGL